MARECGKKLSARGSPSCTSAATTTGMRVALAALVCVLACMPAVLGAFPKKRTYDSHHYYVAELVQRDPCSAQVTPEHVARALDAELVERVGELEGHWLLRAEKADAIARRSVLAEVPEQDDPVLRRFAAWSDNGHEKRCVGSQCVTMACLSNTVRSLERQKIRMRHKRLAIPEPGSMSDVYPRTSWNAGIPPPPPPLLPLASHHPQEPRAPVPSNRTDSFAKAYGIRDPLFYKQWHILNEQMPGHDLNIEGAWKLASGKGVTVSLIDDGVEYTHPDIAHAFEPAASYDFNDHTELPWPRLFDDTHGTRCAGEIAAAKNDVCGVGVAPDAHIAAVRILSAPISDADEAAALNYGYQISDIYSCSWGPSDSGRSMDGPHGLVAKAMLNGIYNGRKGRGSLFVFAGGNGGGLDDQCNFDGYTNSIYTITIAAVDSSGHRPYYSEMCSAIIASAWSSGKNLSITTSNVRGQSNRTCTSVHGGTSAAAPLVAGVLALALEVRPELTWRDAQHLIIQSSVPVNEQDPDWQRTAAGLMYSHKSGFGVVDATRLVENARKHKLVPPQSWLEMPRQGVNASFAPMQPVNNTMNVTQAMMNEANLASVEHVTVKVWIEHPRRGDVQVSLYGPHGTKSVLASPRRYDNDVHGFPGWTFMTLKHWNESPIGTWTIEVSDHGKLPEPDDRNNASSSSTSRGAFGAWSLTFWGAAKDPKLARPWNFPDGSLEQKLTLPGAPTTTVLGSPPAYASSFPGHASTSRQLMKPTFALPPDHHVDPGETSHVFGSVLPTDRPEADTAFLPGFSGSSSSWIGTVLVLVLFIGLLLLVIFALRYRLLPWARGPYTHLPDDEAMQLDWIRHGSGSSSLPSRDLYNAFALDDDDLDDEDRDADDKDASDREDQDDDDDEVIDTDDDDIPYHDYENDNTNGPADR